jgi:hypothetical protein
MQLADHMPDPQSEIAETRAICRDKHFAGSRGDNFLDLVHQFERRSRIRDDTSSADMRG